MLRRAEAAEITRSGWPRRRAWFWPGPAGSDPVALSARHHRRVLAEHEHRPVEVAVIGARTYWMFRGRCWWEHDGLGADDVHALLLDRELRQARRLERARLVTGRPDADPLARPSRPAIPDDVKTAVWRRDEGRCARCGSAESLEFDHVIPLAMGGSNTARNLQLLCEPCNRQKGPSLA
jgi:5-methylcytosine-specific restriction endonuclease McrA